MNDECTPTPPPPPTGGLWTIGDRGTPPPPPPPPPPTGGLCITGAVPAEGPAGGAGSEAEAGGSGRGGRSEDSGGGVAGGWGDRFVRGDDDDDDDDDELALALALALVLVLALELALAAEPGEATTGGCLRAVLRVILVRMSRGAWDPRVERFFVLFVLVGGDASAAPSVGPPVLAST